MWLYPAKTSVQPLALVKPSSLTSGLITPFLFAASCPKTKNPLTNLPNRLLFADRLEHALAGALRKEGQIAVLFMDLDNFKVINDSLGHEAGDELLKAVAERLLTCKRPEDILSRFGGDEFALLLEDVADGGMAIGAAERILRELQAPFVLRGRRMSVTASIGIVVAAPGEDRGVDELLRDADLAMYSAKR